MLSFRLSEAIKPSARRNLLGYVSDTLIPYYASPSARCLDNARTRFYCSQLFRRAARHDKGGSVGGGARGMARGYGCAVPRVEYVISTKAGEYCAPAARRNLPGYVSDTLFPTASRKTVVFARKRRRRHQKPTRQITICFVAKGVLRRRGEVPHARACGRRGRKKEERPLSRQQVAASSPYRRGAIAGLCPYEMPRQRALTLGFAPTLMARCSA